MVVVAIMSTRIATVTADTCLLDSLVPHTQLDWRDGDTTPLRRRKEMIDDQDQSNLASSRVTSEG